MEFNKNRKAAEQCPCGKSNRDGKFSPLKNNPKAGKCFSCGKFFAPARDWNAGAITYSPLLRPPSQMPDRYFNDSMYHGSNNYLKQFLLTKFTKQNVDDVFKHYCCGSLQPIKGSTVFWQITTAGELRAGKIMLYDKQTGHRLKNNPYAIQWVHTYYKLKNFTLKQCFFGEHLLAGSHQPVVIVESEKTALVCALTMPQFLWLASGSITGLHNKNFAILRHRNVTLAPDVGAFTLWKTCSQELTARYGMNITVSSMLETVANDEEKQLKIDVADKILEGLG